MSQKPSLIPIDPETLELTVYVPVEGTFVDAIVRNGAAIVSDGRMVDGQLVCYFQDYGLGGQEQPGGTFHRFTDRAYHAADRMLFNYPHGYPTTAKGTFKPEDLVRVGTLDYKRGELALEGAQAEASVAGWIGQETLDPAELATSSNMKHEQRRALEKMLATGDPLEREKARHFARAMHFDPAELGL